MSLVARHCVAVTVCHSSLHVTGSSSPGVKVLGIDEWLVSVDQLMYEDTTTVVRVNGCDSKASALRIGVHHG